jgi:hypothetical protein
MGVTPKIGFAERTYPDYHVVREDPKGVMGTSCGLKKASKTIKPLDGHVRASACQHAFPGRMRKAVIGTQNEGERGSCSG